MPPNACARKAIVIGAGLGGLATALRLSAKGWHVTVCERGPSPGGKMNRWREGSFTFDTGPSLITMPWVFRELFEAAGGRLEEHCEFIRMQPLADIHFTDGTRFLYTSSLPDWIETVRQLDARDVVGFFRLMRLGARLYELSNATFLRRPPTAPPDLRVLKALRHLPILKAWGNYHKAVEAHVRSPYMRQLYDRYPTYVGSSPYESPATLLVIPYIEFAFGGWYAKGGLYTIVEGLVELATRSNVLLLTDTQVDRIERRNGRVKGVVTHSGTFLPADVVVMNGDPARLNDLLIGPQGQTAGAEHRSLSGFVLLLGVKRTLSALHHHSVFFSRDYRREFYDLFGRRRFPEEPTVYVSAPSRNDRALTPGEGEALFVMANAPANGGDIWGLEQIASARRRVLDRLYAGGFPYVEADVAVETVWTPRTFERRYQMPGGAIYGSNSHGWRKAFLRPPNKHPRVGGLYCVGGGSHPGGGTPTVLLSATITCDLIEKYEIA